MGAAGTAVAAPRRTAWVVWAAAMAVYVVAVAQRSSFGVAGLEAADRFGVDATVLSLFVVVQLSVYALMQLPVGVALDGWGPRRLLVVGSATMVAGQLGMVLAPNVGIALTARVLVGAGDAAIFISATTLVARWFDRRRVPLLTQLTGIIGQLGQVVSALPFALALHRYGWTTAFLGLAALGVAASVAGRALIRDAPAGATPTTPTRRLDGLAATLRHPGTWLGFWTHMLGQCGINVFALMWGFPFLVEGQGLSTRTAGALLALNVVAAIVVGPLVGEFTARHPLRRSWAVLALGSVATAAWLAVLVPATPRPVWQLAGFVVVIAAATPMSLIGLDFAATTNPPHRMGAAQAVANMGGFVSAVLVMVGVGVVLDHRAPGGDPTLADYRSALSLVLVPCAVALVGVLVARARTRAAGKIVVPPLADAWARWRADRRR